MLIDLTKLNNSSILNLDTDVTIDLTKYSNNEIKDLKNLHVTGNIYYNSSDNLNFSLHLTGTMVLVDTISLEDFNYDLALDIEEEYALNSEFLQEYYEKEQNTLDIIPILWENIVLEVPMRHTKVKNAEASGDGWHLGTPVKTDEIDPRMAKLAKLLENREE